MTNSTSNFRRRALAGALGLVTAVALQTNLGAQASPEASDTEAKVQALLAGVEAEPSAEQWQALGATAVPVLVAKMNDGSAGVVQRGRAAIALSHFPGEATELALTTAIHAEKTPIHLRGKAMKALALVASERALPVLVPRLEDKSVRTRMAAIKAVSFVGTAAARRALTDWREREPKGYLREEIDAALALPVKPTPKEVPTPKETPTPKESPAPEETPTSGGTP